MKNKLFVEAYQKMLLSEGIYDIWNQLKSSLEDEYPEIYPNEIFGVYEINQAIKDMQDAYIKIDKTKFISSYKTIIKYLEKYKNNELMSTTGVKRDATKLIEFVNDYYNKIINTAHFRGL